MSFIDKIKIIMKGAKPVGEFVHQVQGAKLKFKTIPFWTTLITTLLTIAAAFNGVISGTTAILITAPLNAAYQLLRGFDKMDQNGVKPVLQSTEFWIGALGILSAAFLQVQQAGINNTFITGAIGFIGGVMAIAQNLGAIQPTDIPPVQ